MTLSKQSIAGSYDDRQAHLPAAFAMGWVRYFLPISAAEKCVQARCGASLETLDDLDLHCVTGTKDKRGVPECSGVQDLHLILSSSVRVLQGEAPTGSRGKGRSHRRIPCLPKADDCNTLFLTIGLFITFLLLKKVEVSPQKAPRPHESLHVRKSGRSYLGCIVHHVMYVSCDRERCSSIL